MTLKSTLTNLWDMTRFILSLPFLIAIMAAAMVAFKLGDWQDSWRMRK